jgi:hypothetical protein
MLMIERTNRASTIVSRIQRNHGLEHATLHLIGEKYPHLALAGYSDVQGFWIVGNVEAGIVIAAATEALERMRMGERQLAIHANCGTNFMTSGILAGLTAWLTMIGDTSTCKKKLDRLPILLILVTLAIIISRPFGMLIQSRLTTSGEPITLEVTRIVSRKNSIGWTHRVFTQG